MPTAQENSSCVQCNLSDAADAWADGILLPPLLTINKALSCSKSPSHYALEEYLDSLVEPLGLAAMVCKRAGSLSAFTSRQLHHECSHAKNSNKGNNDHDYNDSAVGYDDAPHAIVFVAQLWARLRDPAASALLATLRITPTEVATNIAATHIEMRTGNNISDSRESLTLLNDIAVDMLMSSCNCNCRRHPKHNATSVN